ncbi:cupredoxin family copper-binding protein [Dyella humi]
MNLSSIFRAGCASILMVALCGAAVSCRAADVAPAKGKNYQVAIQNFAFAPKTITVPVGARVVWTNRDEEPHVITSAGSLFASSKALDTSDSYGVTFSKPGTYAYYCSIHPMMVGTIIVQ